MLDWIIQGVIRYLNIGTNRFGTKDPGGESS